MKSWYKNLLHNKPLAILLFIFSSFINLSAQSSNTYLNFLIHRGLDHQTNVTIINDEHLTDEDSVNIQNLHAQHDLLYSSNKAYILVKGTGKLFELDSNLNITKIDKTIYGGHAFGAANFIYNDTIYSTGGYGFLSINGALRYFNASTKEWDVFRLNKNIPFANGINANYFIDTQNGKLYLLYNIGHPEYVDIKFEAASKCYLAILDLKSKKWIETNYLINTQIAKSFSDLSFIQIIGDKVLANSKFNSKALLLDIPHNSMQEVSDAKYTEWIQLKSHINNGAIINISDTVYLLNKDSVSNFYLHDTDLKPLALKIYEPINELFFSENMILIFLSIIILLLIVALIYFIKKLNAQKINNSTESENNIGIEKRSISDFYLGLSEIEKQTLELIVKNSWNGLTTSVNQINKILGTERKTGKVQNNIRGDIIMELNNKFKAYTLLNDNLVDRKKSEFDKRHIEYFISENLINKFPKKLFD